MDATGEQGKLSVEKVVEQGVTFLTLAGTIDESFSGAAVAKAIKTDTVVLSLREVKKISSFGIREWVDLMGALSPKCDTILLVECSPKVVDQFNMVANFAGDKGQLYSLYAPYRCDHCDVERQRLLVLERDIAEMRGGLADRLCAVCGNSEYFDEDPQSYFASVLAQPPLVVPAGVQSLLNQRLAYSSDARLKKTRVDKRVVGKWTLIALSSDLDQLVRRDKIVDGLEGHVAIDVAGLGQISARGLAEWDGLISDVAKASDGVWLRGVGVHLLDQWDVSAALQGRGGLWSVRLPYRCEKCQTAVTRTLIVADQAELLRFATAPDLACDECGQVAVCTGGDLAMARIAASLRDVTQPLQNSAALSQIVSLSAEDRAFLTAPLPAPSSPSIAKVASVPAIASAPVPASRSSVRLALAIGVAALAAAAVVAVLVLRRGSIAQSAGGGAAATVASASQPGGVPAWVNDSAHVGYAETRDVETAKRFARAVAFAQVVDRISAAAAATDPTWSATVYKSYSEAQRRLTAASEQGGRPANPRAPFDVSTLDPALEQAKMRYFRQAAAVADALVRTAGALLPEATLMGGDLYWQEISIGSGATAERRFRAWVRPDISSDLERALGERYQSQQKALGAQVSALFPGIFWRWADEELKSGGAIVRSLEPGSPLAQIGLSAGDVIVALNARAVGDGAGFVSISTDEYARVVDQGGRLPVLVKRDDGALSEYGLVVTKQTAIVSGDGFRVIRTERNRPPLVPPTSTGNVFSDNPDE